MSFRQLRLFSNNDVDLDASDSSADSSREMDFMHNDYPSGLDVIPNHHARLYGIRSDVLAQQIEKCQGPSKYRIKSFLKEQYPGTLKHLDGRHRLDMHYLDFSVHDVESGECIAQAVCPLMGIPGWSSISQVLSRDCFVEFSFAHYSMSTEHSNEFIEPMWDDEQFTCINLVMKEVEGNKGIKSLLYQPYYHPQFHNIVLTKFVRDKTIEQLQIWPTFYRYCQHDYVYSALFSSCHGADLLRLDISNGTIHKKDFGWFEGLYTLFSRVPNLKILFPCGIDIVTFGNVVLGVNSKVEELVICFDGDLSSDKFVELGGYIRESLSLRRLQVTIRRELQSCVIDMLHGSNIRLCDIHFNNQLSEFDDFLESPNSNLIRQGIDMFTCTDMGEDVGVALSQVGFSDEGVQQSMDSNHRIFVRAEGVTSRFNFDINSLNICVQDGTHTEKECALQKAAMYVCRFEDFEVNKEFGTMHTWQVIDIVSVLGNHYVAFKETSVMLDPNAAFSASFRIIRDRLSTEICSAVSCRSNKRKFV